MQRAACRGRPFALSARDIRNWLPKAHRARRCGSDSSEVAWPTLSRFGPQSATEKRLATAASDSGTRLNLANHFNAVRIQLATLAGSCSDTGINNMEKIPKDVRLRVSDQDSARALAITGQANDALTTGRDTAQQSVQSVLRLL